MNQANKPAALIRAALAQLLQQQASLYRQPLEPMRQRVQRVAVKALLDPTLTGDLHIAQSNLEAEEANHRKYAELQGAITVLERDLQEAEFAERIVHIREADAAHSRLAADYDASCRQVCRIFEQLIDQQQMLSRTTPGWHAPQLPSFNFSHMVPPGWVGCTSEHVTAGGLAWLVQEKARAA